MYELYLIPIESVVEGVPPYEQTYRGPSYLRWRKNPDGLSCLWSMMDYGFIPIALVVISDPSPEVQSALAAQPDVYKFPDNLDTPVDDPSIDAFFEGLYIPTDWLTPSTTYRQLVRQVAGMFQFNQAFSGLTGQSLFGAYSLEDSVQTLTPELQEGLAQTLNRFEMDPILGNPKLRSVIKRADEYWSSKVFYMGLGYMF